MVYEMVYELMRVAENGLNTNDSADSVSAKTEPQVIQLLGVFSFLYCIKNVRVICFIVHVVVFKSQVLKTFF